MAKSIEQIEAENKEFIKQLAKNKPVKPKVIVLKEEQHRKLKKGKFKLSPGLRYRIEGKNKIHIVK